MPRSEFDLFKYSLLSEQARARRFLFDDGVLLLLLSPVAFESLLSEPARARKFLLGAGLMLVSAVAFESLLSEPARARRFLLDAGLLFENSLLSDDMREIVGAIDLNPQSLLSCCFMYFCSSISLDPSLRSGEERIKPPPLGLWPGTVSEPLRFKRPRRLPAAGLLQLSSATARLSCILRKDVVGTMRLRREPCEAVVAFSPSSRFTEHSRERSFRLDWWAMMVGGSGGSLLGLHIFLLAEEEECEDECVIPSSRFAMMETC